MKQRYPTAAIPSKQAGSFYAAYFAALGVVLPFLGPYLELRGLTAVGIGIATAAFSLAKLAYTPLVGWWVDRGGWFRGILSAHLALSAAALAVLGAASGPWSFVIALTVVGLGYGTVLPLVEAAVLERLPAAGYGVLRLWGSVGFIAAATAAGALVAGDVVARFPLALAVTLALLWLASLPFEQAARPAAATGGGRLPAIAWWLLALLTLHQVAHGPYYAFFSIHLLDSGVSGSAVAALWSLGVVAELVAFSVGTRLERRFGLVRLLGACLLVSPLRWALLSLPVSATTLVAAQAGHAVTFALVHLAAVQLVQRIVPEGAVRKAQALYSGLSFGLGVILGTAVAGPLYGGLGGRGSFAVAAALSAVLFAAWLALSPSVGLRVGGGDRQKIT